MIKYETGDATQPEGKGLKIICHVNNNIGRWGKGFVMAVSDRWPETRTKFLELGKWVLGDVQLVQVEDDIIVANMIAQDGIGIPNKERIDYKALEKCLKIVAEYAKAMNAIIHMPKIGCGLGGGSWTQIESIIQTSMHGLSVTVYEL
jgi:O-acetyl-ADP-ribose deacetylase (regulator of RNase III)